MSAPFLFIRTVITRDWRFLGVTLLACAVAAIVAMFQYAVYASFVRSAGVVPRVLGGDFWVTAASVECFDFPNPIAEDYGASLARYTPDVRYRRVVFGFATWRSPTGNRGNVAVIGVDGTTLPDTGFQVDRSDVARLDLSALAPNQLASISDVTLHHAATVDTLPTFLGAPYVVVPFEQGRELLRMDPSSASYLIGDLPKGSKINAMQIQSAASAFPEISVMPTSAFVDSSARYWQNKTGAGLAILLAAVLAALLMAILLANGVLRFIQRYQQDLLSLVGHGASRRDISVIVGGTACLIALATTAVALLFTPVMIALFNPVLPWTEFFLIDAIPPVIAIIAALGIAMLSAQRALAAFGPEAVFRS
jgi:hypothetical protein